MIVIVKSRKKIAKQVRSQITGGDVVQVEEFQVDIDRVMPRAKKEPFKEQIDETSL